MKRVLSVVLIAALTFILLLPSCVGSGENYGAQQDSGITVHKIGVAVYNIDDAEVMSFRNYLENYIDSCFEDVEFYYSSSISSEEDEMKFISDAIELGVEGIMSFITYDLAREVETCAEKGVYYMLASGTVSDAEFEKAADNEYFLGVVGPGTEIEYQAGEDLASFFAADSDGTYLILSGGAAVGNEMHRVRTLAMLDVLAQKHGLTDIDAKMIAQSENETIIEKNGVKICVLPGYISQEEYRDRAAAAVESGEYSAVLSVMAVSGIKDELERAGVSVGVIDSFTDDNLQLFKDGVLSYVTGKYCSEIGPSFAAMYNALTGYAGQFRDNGRAFKITQGFWNAVSYEQYCDMSALASGTYVNAYNYEDLYSVCKAHDAGASLEKLVELAQAYTYEDAQMRRAD